MCEKKHCENQELTCLRNYNRRGSWPSSRTFETAVIKRGSEGDQLACNLNNLTISDLLDSVVNEANANSSEEVKIPSEDDYETIKLISNGAYGAVYLVRHKETRQRFAMKKINKQNLILRNQVEQAFAERDIMSFTDNPFVVSMFCSFETKIGLMNLATNLYEGYLDREARQFNDKQVYGTPEYIAPEVILRQGYGKPVDWWSMGIILYEFLIGCVPFFGETPEELFAHVINDKIEWPDDEEWPLPEEAKHLITQLLQQNPMDRLGTGGSHEVKDHPFFGAINWDALLRQKAEFIPRLDNDEDTSYFDTRTDRYNHELEDSEEHTDTDDSSMFSSFSSCSPRYHKVYSRIEQELAQEKLMKSSSTSSITDESTEGKSLAEKSHGESCLMRTQSLNEDNSTKQIEKKTHKPSNLVIKNDPKTATSESSQTESDGVSPQIQRKRKSLTTLKSGLPKFSVSVDNVNTSASKNNPPSIREIPPEDSQSDASGKSTDTATNTQKPNLPFPTSARISIPSSNKGQQKGRAVIKSASASGLSLIIPTEESNTKKTGCHFGSPGGSSVSSRDASPNRETSSPFSQLKPPVIIRKGPRGFGFTLRAIRVYYGDSDIYTVHHLIMAVENNSPAFEAGLRPGDLITHINGEPIQGLLHHQVLQLVLSGGGKINIRTTPLENTTIKSGGRKRNPTVSKMARRPTVVRHRKTPTVKRSDSDKKRRSNLLRRVNSRRASAEIHQLMASGTNSPTFLSPSRSYQSLHKTITSSSNDSSVNSTPNNMASNQQKIASKLSRLQCSGSDSSMATSSQSSSPSSSVPNSPASLTHSPHFPRPSTLHGLKHKLAQTFRSPRRKSCDHIPISPLARTPSPSLLPVATSSPSTNLRVMKERLKDSKKEGDNVHNRHSLQ
ncbi:microtubule-associated serine/threonine-protein kinase 3-like isoform X2 [Dinothrombium tinctorium]|uniref:non-specific serine/threonine protein kinase n=1 Tax=Dinothrombium tinctorium TaxID=1965070 RepID=A0A3S3PTU4_9ACAR|nr:microtubule-associated serine/threonine-protein kinase 3-like isoform X2 [Dinothrombium tinctorium]RWS08085.1 microtubule-associated serine/threonine-protein kinase 3-like isoform X2 [Dinothrombium tinctorium]